MITIDVDAEIALMRTIGFIDELTNKGALTESEAHGVLAAAVGDSVAVVGSLLLRVRLDKHRV